MNNKIYNGHGAIEIKYGLITVTIIIMSVLTDGIEVLEDIRAISELAPGGKAIDDEGKIYTTINAAVRAEMERVKNLYGVESLDRA